MRSALRLICALAVSTVACQRQPTPAAPSPSQPAPVPVAYKITVSCPSCQPTPPGAMVITEIGKSAALKVMAALADLPGEVVDVTREATFESSDPSTGTVTSAGMLTTIDPGLVTIAARYRGSKGTLLFRVDREPGVLYPGDVQGVIFERTTIDEELPAHVELVGADFRSRSPSTFDSSRFWFAGVAHGGLEIVVSRRGYQTRRLPVSTLPVKLDILLELDPSLVRERLVADRCGDPATIAPARVAFRSVNAGFFRIVSRSYPYDGELKIMLDGQPVEYRYPGIDYELPVGNLTHELTLSCIAPPGSGSVTYLRPR